MAERPLDQHKAALKQLTQAAAGYSETHTMLLKKASTYLVVHMRLVTKILAAPEAYDWLKEEVMAHQEAHTRLVQEITDSKEALNTLLNEICGYLSKHGDIVEAEALDILARAEKRSRPGPG